MRNLILVFLLLLSRGLYATDYNLTDGQSIAYANSLPLKSGDHVNFKGGLVYTGQLNCVSGVEYNSYSGQAIFAGTGVLVSMYHVTGVIVKNIKVIDLSMNVSDHTAQAKISYAFSVDGSNNCTIDGCDISLVGVGIEIHGNKNTVIRNKFSNLRMVRNTPTSVNSDDDYGANPMVVSGDDNIITQNEFRDCWATSYDYGLDGGAVEFFGGYSRNQVTHNTAINCDGFAEFGSSNGGTVADNYIAFNLLINNGLLTWINGYGQFGLSVTNLQYFNNIIVETNNWTNKAYLFDFSGTPTSTMLSLKNNVLYLTSGIDVVKSGKFTGNLLSKSNNVYKLSNGSVTNFTLDASELSTSANLFLNTLSADPALWDCTLSTVATSKGILNLNTPPIDSPIIVPPPPATIPEAPSAISGATSVCPYKYATYSVQPVNGVSYVWTLPLNATKSSSTNSVTLYFGKYFSGGTLKVQAKNDNGISGAVSFSITKKRHCR